MAATPAPAKVRDADRSREAILAAAERLFAERGYDATSLQDIAAAAGLSRGTPSYFFGSKDGLYRAVLERAFAHRQAATEAAFAPVREWCEGGEGADALRAALTEAADGYMRFLARRPAFTRLVMREELAAGRHMHERVGASTAMRDAFGAVRGTDRGLAPFDVDDAVVLFVSLTFAPLSYNATLMRANGRDLSRPADRRRQIELAVDQLMHLLGA